jgi:S-adenosylmethionine decarboxylase
MHLVIDGFGADETKLQDLALVFDLLDNYPGAIGMTKIMPPYVFRYTGVKPEDWGVSGVVLIAESHISIHTFPDKNYINIDVFSCKAFDAELAVQFMKDKFGITDANAHVLERGLEYPHEIQRASELVRMERLEVAVAGATQPT